MRRTEAEERAQRALRRANETRRKYAGRMRAIPKSVEDAVRAALRYAMRELGIKRTVSYGFFVPGSERMAAEWPCRTFIAVGEIVGAVRVVEPDHILD